MTHEELIAAIRSRQEKKTEFNYGILTADRYVKTLQDCVGLPACYKFCSAKQTSFQDVIEKAAKTLTYANPEMVVEEKQSSASNFDGLLAGHADKKPKDALVVFRHVLSTPKKDRDGDILRSEGAEIDPKMLLLWQHVHTLPIGKMLYVVQQNEKGITLVSAIVDMNETAHDAAVMVDNDMARFSHGFRAIQFDKTKGKEEEGQTTSPGGFDIKLWEAMEESVVSVPSNTDAQTEEVLLSLVEGGKLTSGLMKEMGKSIRERRPTQSSVKYKVTAGDSMVEIETSSVGEFEKIFDKTKEKNDASRSKDRGAKTTCGKCGGEAGTKECACPSKEAGSGAGKGGGAKAGAGSTDKEVKPLDVAADGTVAGVAADGTPMRAKLVGDSLASRLAKEEKAGRVLSKLNYDKLVDVAEDMRALDDHVMDRPGKALCKGCRQKVVDVIKSAGYDDSGKAAEAQTKEMTDEEIFVTVVAKFSDSQQTKLLKILQAIEAQKRQASRAQQYKALVG